MCVCLCVSIWSLTGPEGEAPSRMEEAGSGRSDAGSRRGRLASTLSPSDRLSLASPSAQGWGAGGSGTLPGSRVLRVPAVRGERAQGASGKRGKGCAPRRPRTSGETVKDQTPGSWVPPSRRTCFPPGLWLLKGLGAGTEVAATSTLTRGQPGADRVGAGLRVPGSGHMGLLPAPSCPLHEDEWLCLLAGEGLWGGGSPEAAPTPTPLSRPTLRKCCLLWSCQASPR